MMSVTRSATVTAPDAGVLRLSGFAAAKSSLPVTVVTTLSLAVTMAIFSSS